MTTMTLNGEIPLSYKEKINLKKRSNWDEQSILPDAEDIKFAALIEETWSNSQKQKEMNEYVAKYLNENEQFVKLYGKITHTTKDSKSRIDGVNPDYIFEFRSRNFNLFANDGLYCWKVDKHDRGMLCTLSKYDSLRKYREQGKKPLYISFLYGKHFIVNDYTTFENSTFELFKKSKLKNGKLRYFDPNMSVENGGGYNVKEMNYYLPFHLSKIFVNKNTMPPNHQIGKIAFNNPNVYV